MPGAVAATFETAATKEATVAATPATTEMALAATPGTVMAGVTDVNGRHSD
jgi:hypothetical protein